jgi:phosphoribosyl 1,2-cyclic phosphate phosphodiesterase
LINDDLLIDLGPDVISSANRHDLYLGRLHTVLITHRHSDHWLPSNLNWREPSFAVTPVSPLIVFGPHDALVDIEPQIERATDLTLRPVSAGDQWSSGSYQITAVPATHGEGTLEPLLYVIDDGIHRVFYATDTSSLGSAAWDLLRSLAPVDLVLLDATAGLGDGGSGHHGIEKFLRTRARMIKEGVLTPGSILVAHHFSHNGGLTHAALVERLVPHDALVAYDGLTLAL